MEKSNIHISQVFWSVPDLKFADDILSLCLNIKKLNQTEISLILINYQMALKLLLLSKKETMILKFMTPVSDYLLQKKPFYQPIKPSNNLIIPATSPIPKLPCFIYSPRHPTNGAKLSSTIKFAFL